MIPSDLDSALVQLVIAETALEHEQQTTGVWVAMESIRRARASIQHFADFQNGHEH